VKEIEEIKRGYRLTRGGAQAKHKPPKPRAFAKRGGIEGDDDRGGLGWPPWELALRFVLPEHQSTTMPPFLRKARGQKEEGKKTA
jgi:hypothetical protein